MTEKNFDIFIPARIDSSRLPQKHLLTINKTPLLKILVNRLRNSKKIRKIIVCTTQNPSDDKLVEFLKKEKIEFFRGEEHDILKRFLDASHYFKTDVIIDVEGDKIYTDPIFVDKIIDYMETSNIDFIIGNDNNSTFNPSNHLVHGFIPAGIKTSALEKICKLKNSNNTETGYKEFFLLPNIFKTKFLVENFDEALSNKIRLTIDYHEDFILAKKIFSKLEIDCSYQEILNLLLNNPEFLKISENTINQWKLNYKQNIADFSLKEY